MHTPALSSHRGGASPPAGAATACYSYPKKGRLMKLGFLLFTASLLAAGCAAQTSRKKVVLPAQETRPAPEPTQMMKDLRDMYLTSPPKKFNFDSSRADYKVYGALMETAHPEVLATIVSLRDGNASLYLGYGGGVIGGFAHENVRKAATDFVKESEQYVAGMEGTKSFPYPAVGRVRFYLLTFEGVFTAEADEKALEERRHEMSPLFYKGHEVLTQLRLVAEKQGQ